jgi:hypothetical protein
MAKSPPEQQTIVVGVRLRPEQRAAIQTIAKRHSLTLGELISNAVEALYPQEYKQERVFFAQRSRKSVIKSVEADGVA